MAPSPPTSTSPGYLDETALQDVYDLAEERVTDLVAKKNVDLELLNAWIRLRLTMSRLIQAIPESLNTPLGYFLEELGLPGEVRAQIANRLGAAFEGTLDVEAFHRGHMMQSPSDLATKGGGARYLTRAIEGPMPHLAEHHPRLVRLAREVSVAFEGASRVEAFRRCVDLVYCLNGGAIEPTQDLIHSMLRNQELRHVPSTTPESGTDENDFEVLLRFLSVYSDVSQAVIEGAADSNIADQIYEQSRASLTHILRDPLLHQVAAQRPSVFDLLQRMFRDAPLVEGRLVGNPWFVGDLQGSPYDPHQIAELVRPTFSRHSLGLVLTELNRFQRDSASGELVQKPFPNEQSTWALLLHLLDSKAIVLDENARRLFFKLLNALLEVSSFEEADSEQDAPRYLLEHALRARLKDPDPHLDQVVALPSRVRCRAATVGQLPTVRTLLEDLAKVHFSADELREILSLLRARSLSVNPNVPMDPAVLARHFNMARVGWVDYSALRAGELLDTLKAGPDQFKEIIAFLGRACDLLFGKGYQALPYTSAHSAWSDFCQTAKLSGGEIYTTGEEYENMLRPFSSDRVHPVSLSKKADEGGSRIPLSPEEFIEALSQAGATDTTQGVIFMSTYTRLGNAPFPSPDGLMRFIELARERFPHLRIVLDGAQALGRTSVDELSTLKPDAYIFSGGKAAHVGVSGAVLVSAQWMRELKSQGYAYNPSQIDLQRTAAMAFVLAALARPHDGFSMEGNTNPALADLPLAEKFAVRMRQLTEYTLSKARNYAADFRAAHSGEVAIAAMPSDPEEDLFSVEVIAPSHGQVQFYGGIVTLNFPSVNAKKLVKDYKEVEGLEHRGFQLHFEGYQNRLLSISLHPWHTEADVDALFSAIIEIHSALLVQSHKSASVSGKPPQYRYLPLSSWPEGKQPF